MNYFKYSPLPKLASNRLRKYDRRNPSLIAQRDNSRIENLDIMKVHAWRDAKEKGQHTRWAGGDDQDRLEYI